MKISDFGEIEVNVKRTQVNFEKICGEAKEE